MKTVKEVDFKGLRDSLNARGKGEGHGGDVTQVSGFING